MKFTFGIITTKKTCFFLPKIIASVHKLNIPKDSYEIIVIGHPSINGLNIKSYPFFEYRFDIKEKKIKSGWITRKKNLITKRAQFENVVFIHDYIVFQPNWYESFLKFGEEFQVCLTPIRNFDNTRFRDWSLWIKNNHPIDYLIENSKECLLPYGEHDLSNFMYISGSYWIAKRDFMLDTPLDETLTWGQAEDVEWSFRARKKTKFKLNTSTHVNLLKYKDTFFNEMSFETLSKIKSITK